MSEEFHKISIVIPSLNQGQYLESCLLSIVNQCYPNLEIIVMDGGSEDETLEILARYNDVITFWSSEKDSGQAYALSKGI